MNITFSFSLPRTLSLHPSPTSAAPSPCSAAASPRGIATTGQLTWVSRSITLWVSRPSSALSVPGIVRVRSPRLAGPARWLQLGAIRCNKVQQGSLAASAGPLCFFHFRKRIADPCAISLVATCCGLLRLVATRGSASCSSRRACTESSPSTGMFEFDQSRRSSLTSLVDPRGPSRTSTAGYRRWSLRHTPCDTCDGFDRALCLQDRD